MEILFPQRGTLRTDKDALKMCLPTDMSPPTDYTWNTSLLGGGGGKGVLSFKGFKKSTKISQCFSLKTFGKTVWESWKQIILPSTIVKSREQLPKVKHVFIFVRKVADYSRQLTLILELKCVLTLCRIVPIQDLPSDRRQFFNSFATSEQISMFIYKTNIGTCGERDVALAF